MQKSYLCTPKFKEVFRSLRINRISKNDHASTSLCDREIIFRKTETMFGGSQIHNEWL